MIRALFFDLDDTLIRYDAAYDAALLASHQALTKRYEHVTYSALRNALFYSYEKRFGYGSTGFADLGILSVRKLRDVVTEDALRALGIKPDAGFVAHLIETHEAVESAEIRLLADTIETLDRLEKSFPLGVITNGPSAMQRGKLAALELTHRFSHIVVDTEFGHPKPDTRIFSFAADLTGCAPSELLFVGNSPEADVAGAVASGWTCVWLNTENVPLPEGSALPHYRIRRLSELLTLLPIAEVLNRD